MFLVNTITPITKEIAMQTLYGLCKRHVHPPLAHASKVCFPASDVSSEQQWNLFCKIMILQPFRGGLAGSCFFLNFSASPALGEV